ncbi:hypothetical protein DFQ26_000005 [Actinomortierella ambigua]|nr:hypothetical protein DFQ26_000005 [Actinomortierella ambigua]
MVNEDHPEFWNRLYHRMDPSTAVVVYAMCTVGALYTDETTRSGHLDGLASEFYRRTRALLDNLAPCAASIQAYLIMQPYLTATHQEEEHRRALELMLHAASEINLAETARQIAEQDKVSPADIALRNTWRGVVWAEILHHLHTRKGSLTIVPLKNLSGPVLDTRPKDFPGNQSPILDIVYYHLCSYFKILQSIAALKTGVAPRDPKCSADFACSHYGSRLPARTYLCDQYIAIVSPV